MSAGGPPLGPSGFARQHRKPMIVLRAALAVWILAVTVVLCALGHWWGLVFLVALALDLWLLRRVVRA